MTDWEDANVTPDEKIASQIGLVRDDLVAEIGEQALGRLLAEKRLAAVGRGIAAVKEAVTKEKQEAAQAKDEAEKAIKGANEKTSNLQTSLEGLSRKNTEQAKVIDDLRKENAQIQTLRKERDNALSEIKELGKKIFDQKTKITACHALVKGLDEEKAALEQKLEEAKKPKKRAKKKKAK